MINPSLDGVVRIGPSVQVTFEVRDEEPVKEKENSECKDPGHILAPVRREKPGETQEGRMGSEETRPRKPG